MSDAAVILQLAKESDVSIDIVFSIFNYISIKVSRDNFHRRKTFNEFSNANPDFVPPLPHLVAIAIDEFNSELKRIEEAQQEKPKKPEYVGYNSHDSETFYRCPYCHKTFGDWSLFHQKQDGLEPHCPWCKGKLDYKG